MIRFFLLEFPAAFLQGDFFNSKWTVDPRLEYLNHISLGSTIGHEMSHGFDSIGSLFDAEGNLRNWWTKHTKEIFDEKVECLVDQYDNFTDPISGLGLNGTKTLVENIADNGEPLKTFKFAK